MTYEFKTQDGRIVTRFFKSLGTAIKHFESPDNEDTFDHVPDPEDPTKVATRVYGHAGTMFYGDGWDRPAPSGRQFTTGVDATKAVPSLGRPTNNSVLGRS